MEATLRRITVQEVREACEVLGFTLEPGTTYDPARRCACPIGIVAAKLDPGFGGEGFPTLRWLARGLGIDPFYAVGVAEGFDDPGRSRPEAGPKRRAGREDGEAIRKALLGGEPPP